MTSLVHRSTSFFLTPIFGSDPNISTIVTSLALGAIAGVLLPFSAKFFSWFRFQFLHRSKIFRYHHTPQPSPSTSPLSTESNITSEEHSWALVTGASDGIGAGFVSELASHEFNIILHGRNPTKIKKQIASLCAQYPHLQFEPWIVDATDRSTWHTAFTSLLQSIKDRKAYLTVLVNNIGGNPNVARSFTPLSDYDEAELNKLLDMNATFPTQLTRLLLPQLIANKPSLILNMSSAVAHHPIPYLAGYAASKAFNLQLSKTLRLELVAEGHQEVEVLGVTAARVRSAGSGDIPLNWTTPSSRAFAKNVVRLVGCGREEVTGWWSHDLQMWTVKVLPVWIRDWILVVVARGEREGREKAE